MSQPSSLRARNRAKVLRVLLDGGLVSRSALAGEVRLSKVTVTSIIGGLLSEGWLTEAGKAGGLAGRPASLVDLHPRAGTIMGLDVQPAGVRVIRADLRGAGRVESFHPAANREELTGVTWAALERAVTDQPAWGPLRHATLAVPAPVGPLGLLTEPNSLPELDAPLLLARAQEAGFALSVENDVNLSAVAEQSEGAARGEASFALLGQRDSGLGVGLVLAGEVYRGVRGRAGELARARWRRLGAPWPLEGLPPGVQAEALAHLVTALVVALDLDLLVLQDDRTQPLAADLTQPPFGGLDQTSSLQKRVRELLPPEVRVTAGSLAWRGPCIGALLTSRRAVHERLLRSPILASTAPLAPPSRRSL